MQRRISLSLSCRVNSLSVKLEFLHLVSELGDTNLLIISGFLHYHWRLESLTFPKRSQVEKSSQHCLVLIQLSLSYAANMKLETTMSPSGRMTAALLKDLFVVLT